MGVLLFSLLDYKSVVVFFVLRNVFSGYIRCDCVAHQVSDWYYFVCRAVRTMWACALTVGFTQGVV